MGGEAGARQRDHSRATAERRALLEAQHGEQRSRGTSPTRSGSDHTKVVVNSTAGDRATIRAAVTATGARAG